MRVFRRKPKITNGEIAAVDLGSNSFHMVVARVEQGQLVVIDRIREMVRLAAGLDEDNNISEEAASRALECLHRFGQRIGHLDSSQVKAVGTNTLRSAQNSDGFLEMAEQALGHSIGVISGYEEARLTYSGVAHSISDSDRRRLVMDIGGGSTELIIGERLEPIYMESLSVGCVSLSERFFNKDTITEKQFKKAETAVLVEIEPYISRYRALGWHEAVGSSGTIRAVSRVLSENVWTDGLITLSGLEKIKSEIIANTESTMVRLPGLSDKRAPVFPGGVAILIAAFNAMEIESMKVSSGAIREGVLYELIGRQDDKDIREQTVELMIGRFSIDNQHQDKVKTTALTLFQQVAEMWNFEEPDEDLLAWSAGLHEIGLIISHQQYQKHGAYILENMDLAGFSRQEQQRLALLIRCHRGGLPKSLFKSFSEEWVGRLLRLVVLLRLSVILHRSRNSTLSDDFSLSVSKNTLALDLGEGWLESHPLTRADLQTEAEILLEREFVLRFQ